MNEAQRRREIKDYYLGISADEITSYLTPASFDLWESVARYRRALGIGDRWLEVGGGVGDLAAAAQSGSQSMCQTGSFEPHGTNTAPRSPSSAQ